MIRLLSVADTISVSNAIFGFLAVLVLVSNIFEYDFSIHLSLSFILMGLLVDGIDGIVARRIGGSRIGDYLESMADKTTLVIAPSVFIYFVYADVVENFLDKYVYLVFSLVLFLSLGIIRLASFHIMKKDEVFVGLPASASTIILLVLGYFKVELVYILPAIVIIGALMASNIRFLKPDLRINGFAFILIVLTIIFGKNYYGFAPVLLFMSIIFYSVLGPVYIHFSEKKIDTKVSK